MNVLNVQDIERELEKVAAYAIHAAAQSWFLTVARNYLLNLDGEQKRENYTVLAELSYGIPEWANTAIANGKEVCVFDSRQVRRRLEWKAIYDIVDWFNSLNAADPRLNRLTRIDFETAAKASREWKVYMTQNFWDFVKDRPQEVMTFKSGYRWVILTKETEFERESAIMKHCIHNQTYLSRMMSGQAKYYSLRCVNNTPHVTMEVDSEKRVLQCKGQTNQKPKGEYQPFIKEIIVANGWVVRGDVSNIDATHGGQVIPRKPTFAGL